MVSQWNRKTFEQARNECLKVRQFNGVYTIKSVNFPWLDYEDYRYLKDIVELRFLASKKSSDLEFREWISKLFDPVLFFQEYKSWIVLKNRPYCLPVKIERKIIRLLSFIPRNIIESMEPQQQSDEIISSNKSVQKLIEDLDLVVID